MCVLRSADELTARSDGCRPNVRKRTRVSEMPRTVYRRGAARRYLTAERLASFGRL